MNHTQLSTKRKKARCRLTPSLHGQRLAFVPKPSEVDAQHKKQKSLHGVPVVQRMSGLREGAEQIA